MPRNNATYKATVEKATPGAAIKVTVFDVKNGIIAQDKEPKAIVFDSPFDPSPDEDDLDPHGPNGTPPYYDYFTDRDDSARFVKVIVHFKDMMFPIRKVLQVPRFP